MSSWQIEDLLLMVEDLGASDLHVAVGVPPAYRIDGALTRVDGPKIMPADSEVMAKEILTEAQWAEFLEKGELDFAYSIPNRSRYRVNVYRQRGSIGLAIRPIPFQVLDIETLNLPSSIAEMATKQNGLILVTGPTGSGKSTTLAAIIDLINRTQQKHIITLEDPIEYMHRHRSCIVNQREVGVDTFDFASGLRASLREDPDVILVGEMRDLETISIAIRAAETGHLVMATLHTPNAPQTVERIIDVFPPYQQQQVRLQLANSLVSIVAQQLIPRIDKGRIVATEILIATAAVRNLIREGKTHQLRSLMQTGAQHGMHTMETTLQELYDNGFISRDEFIVRGGNPTPSWGGSF